MSKTHDHVAAEFIHNNSTVNADGSVRSVTAKDALKFIHDQHQITPEVMKAVGAAKSDLIAGATRVAAHDLAPRIDAAKKAGNDPAEESATVNIQMPDGRITTKVVAQRTTRDPKSGETSVHHGSVGVRIRTKSLIDKSASEFASDFITKAMKK